MKDDEFMNQKVKDMTIKELADAIKLKYKGSTKSNNQEILNLKQSIRNLRDTMDKEYGKIISKFEDLESKK